MPDEVPRRLFVNSHAYVSPFEDLYAKYPWLQKDTPSASLPSLLKVDYTITSPHGEVTLKTNEHHNLFDSIEEFLDHHKNTISVLLGVAGVSLSGVNVYLGKKKLK